MREKLQEVLEHPLTTLSAVAAWVVGFFEPINSTLSVLYANVGTLVGVAGLSQTYLVPELPIDERTTQMVVIALVVAYAIRKLTPVIGSIRDRLSS